MSADPSIRRPFLLRFLPLAILVLAITVLIAETNSHADPEQLATDASTNVRPGTSGMVDEFRPPVDHAQSLPKEKLIADGIGALAEGGRSDVAEAFATLLMRNSRCDQAQWIDQTGWQRVRVDKNRAVGTPLIIECPALHDKSDRYHFTETMKLAPGEIYISPLDLNVEPGLVEIPLQPMTRTASPFADQGGWRRGVLLINLLKPGKLDEDAWVIMRSHSERGAMIIGGNGLALIQAAARIVLSNHEKWDGSGYRQGLVGDEVPIEVRIVAIADAYDALMSRRPDKEPRSNKDAVTGIQDRSGRHFDPELIGHFLDVVG